MYVHAVCTHTDTKIYARFERMSRSSNVVQFVISVTVVAIISQAAKYMGFLDNSAVVSMTIKGFLTFFSLMLVYFPVSLMLGGIPNRDRFFHRR